MDGNGLESTLTTGLAVPNEWPAELVREQAVGEGFRPGRQFLSGRLEIVRCIGRGGMGVVYEAIDRERRAHVALKTLAITNGAGIYRLKHEFRALTGVSHPNLVRLHELFADGPHWFFTMDLIAGAPFDGWVRPVTGMDEPRLRAAFRQLVAAVDAIHRAGKLHLDLKPSNVLVKSDGQVIVLDFGLASEPPLVGFGIAVDSAAGSGTPGYMAPEQAAGRAPDQAADFYAIGVILFKALTGRLPFHGTMASVLEAKQLQPAPFPDSVEAARAPDLAELCAQLLARNPSVRVDRTRLCKAIGAAAPAPFVPRGFSSESLDEEAGLIMGREQELDTLMTAYRESLHGRGSVVLVQGPSGVGKTALCRTLSIRLRAEGQALVLAGCCHERESVPFKAFDGLADALGRHLRQLPAGDAAALMPRAAYALTALFPALARVQAIAGARRDSVPEPTELQRLAFVAFAELLGRLRDRGPVVLWIDDLQWMDCDSMSLLRHLLVDRCRLPLMLLLTQRDEDVTPQLLMREIMHGVGLNPDWGFACVKVAPLSDAASEALARCCLRDGERVTGLSAAIAREAAGIPLVIMELAVFARDHRYTSLARLSFAHVLATRIAELPSTCQTLLETIATGGQPLHPDVALEASRTGHSDLDLLRAAGLVRGVAGSSGKAVECAHDRIREAVSAWIPLDRASTYCRQLAAALISGPGSDPELVLRCLIGAGERDSATQWAEIAAARAVASLAFDRAATLYQQALELSGGRPGVTRDLWIKLGGVLADAGKGLAAARAYAAAAALCGANRVLELDLHRRMAEQLFAAGESAEGSARLREVCRAIGIRLPTGALRSRLSYAFRRRRFGSGEKIQLGLGVASVVPTPSPEQLLRLHTLQSAMMAFASYRPRLAALLAVDYLELALDAALPRHLVWAFGSLAVYARTLRPVMLDCLDLLAQQAGDTDVDVLAHRDLFHGIVATERGALTIARPHLERALATLPRCEGSKWQMDVASLYLQDVAWACGDFAYLKRTTPATVEDALRRGRIWAAAVLSGFAGSFAWLVSGEVEGCCRQIAQARHRWKPQAHRQLPDYCLEMADAAVAIYTGEPQRAFASLHADRGTYERALLNARGGERYAIYALSAASSLRAQPSLRGHCRRTYVDALRRSSALLRRGGALAPAYICEAVLALNRHDTATATGWLSRALVRYDASGMTMHGAATRRRLGRLLGGSQGEALVASANARMITHGVADVDAITELLCPGCAAP